MTAAQKLAQVLRTPHALEQLEKDAAIGRLLVEWARAVQRGDPDAATFLGQAKAAAIDAVPR
jgi:hypothetical protein